jgi:hypothetical protein
VLKGLSDYHSDETAVEAARRGSCGPNKKGYSHKTSTQKRELTSALSLTEQRAKGSPPEKNTTDKKKELLTLACG